MITSTVAYLIWQLGPQQKVFIDGRADMYEYSGVFQDYWTLPLLETECAFPAGQVRRSILPDGPQGRLGNTAGSFSGLEASVLGRSQRNFRSIARTGAVWELGFQFGVPRLRTRRNRSTGLTGGRAVWRPPGDDHSEREVKMCRFVRQEPARIPRRREMNRNE